MVDGMPLMRTYLAGHGRGELLGHPVVRAVAEASLLSPAQVLLQWNLQHGVAVTTKCSSRAHAIEALHCAPPAARALSSEQMRQLDAIASDVNRTASKRFIPMRGVGSKGHLYAW